MEPAMLKEVLDSLLTAVDALIQRVQGLEARVERLEQESDGNH